MSMVHIDTEIHPVTIEIDDKEYEVAAKTVDIAEKLQKAEINAGKSAKLQHELWRQHLEILLGRTAVRELFSAGKTESLDRMEGIYYGVMEAFNYNGREQRAARQEASVSEITGIAEAVEPINRLLELLERTKNIQSKANGKQFPTIKRPE